MLKSIQLVNFFSYGGYGLTTHLNPDTNILVGINGSGKSNFLKAIQLLSEALSATSSFQQLFNKWGGFDSVCNFSEETKETITLLFELDCDALCSSAEIDPIFRSNLYYQITIHRVGNNSYNLSEEIRTKVNHGERPVYYLKMDNGKGIIAERVEGLSDVLMTFRELTYDTKEASFNGQELVLKQALDPKRFYPLFIIKSALEKISCYSYFDTTIDSSIRRLGEFQAENLLKQDGSNLSALIQRISGKYPLVFDEMVKWLVRVNPNFKDIRFDYIGKHFALILTEKKLARSITLDSLSDGTLRFLLLLSILLNPEKGKTICLDEPEASLHPDMISVLSDLFKEANRSGTQLIVATHSPMLLNMFDLDQILVVEKNEKNESEITIKSEEDFEDWVEDFLPGKLWLQGLLGARR